MPGVLFMAVVSQLMPTSGGFRVDLAAQLSTRARLPLTRTILWLWWWLQLLLGLRMPVGFVPILRETGVPRFR